METNESVEDLKESMRVGASFSGQTSETSEQRSMEDGSDQKSVWL